MNNQYTVEQFVKLEKEHLDRFAQEWNKKLSIKESGYPERMQLGDWDEQFLMWDDHTDL